MPTSKLLPLLLATTAVATASLANTPTTTTAPATDPTTSPSSDEQQAIELDGTLAPRDAFEAKVELQEFGGPLKPTQVVGFGAHVKQGEPLIAFDMTEIDDAILQAASDVEVANANVAKAEADVSLGERSDAAGLEEKQDAVHDAELALDFWKRQDGPDFLKQLELSLKTGQYQIDDQNDELDQLRKMYQSESLTNATADIVVKRAVRQLEMSRAQYEIQKADAEKQRQTTYLDKQQEVERAVISAHQALDEFNAQIAQQKAQRAAALTSARLALRAAQRKLSHLEHDKAAMTITAPFDGVAYYGSFGDGGWQGDKPDAIKTGEKVEAGSTFLTLVKPGQVKVVANASGEQLPQLRVGQTVHVRIAALGEDAIDGTIKLISPLPTADGSFQVTIELAGNDEPRLLPGMKAKIEVAK